jgi:hypothetical protein
VSRIFDLRGLFTSIFVWMDFLKQMKVMLRLGARGFCRNMVWRLCRVPLLVMTGIDPVTVGPGVFHHFG